VSVFGDTSAFYALLVESDETHTTMQAAFDKLLESRRPIWTTSFVIVETMSLLQHRLGLDAAREFDEGVLPVVRVRWVDEALCRLGTGRLFREDRRDVSLVDCVSFEFMKLEGLTTAFAIDRHFSEAGFRLLA